MSATSAAAVAAPASSLSQAIGAWRRELGEERVVTSTDRYNADTSGSRGDLPVALRPASAEQVQRIVCVAQRFAVPIYPVSSGKNWGYGTSVPPRSPAAIVDLSALDRILDFDPELGVVTLEPGVTQGQLCDYLAARDLPFMVPVTGAGPACSVLANALERGFGVTPLTDHFGAILSMKVVLPDGEVFQSYSRGFEAAGLPQAFKWGTGPYLDGLFSQSSLGIVVDASIALQPRAERSGALMFVLRSNRQLEGAAAALRRLLAAAGQGIGAVNLMSRSRVEAMLAGSRKVLRQQGVAVPGQGPPLPAGAWFGFGSVYGSRECFRGLCRLAKRSLRGRAQRVRVYTAADVRRLRRVSGLAAAVGWPALAGMVERLEAALSVVDGIPSTFALPLAYARSGRAEAGAPLNPAQDGCGLFWYSPIVPLRHGVTERFVGLAEGICRQHGLTAPITLTTLSPRCFAATLPLLFDRDDADAERRATACFEALYRQGAELGLVPYRLGAQFMPLLEGSAAGSWPLVEAIKGAVDPNRVLARGRYCPGAGRDD